MVIDYLVKEELKNFFSEKIENRSRKAVVISATSLDADDKKLLATQMAKLGKDLSFEYQLDSSLLAGVIIKLGSSIIDLSLKGELQSLRQKMYESS